MLILLLNLVLSIMLFILVLTLVERRRVERLLALDSHALIMYEPKTVIVSVALIEISFISLMLSFILWFELAPQNGLLFVILIGIAGLIVLPLDFWNRNRRTESISEREDYIRTIEYLFNNESEYQLLDALAGLREEAVVNTHARAALEQLIEREDALGELVKRAMLAGN